MKFLIAVILLPLATAHLCMIYPQQRGTMQKLNMAGADDCNLETKDCGERKAEPPKVTLWAGMKENLVFQKNLDHFNMKTPGSFMVNISPMGDTMKWTPLGKVMDSNTTSLYLYEMMVDVPSMEMDHAVIQVNYMTSNPQAPANFYQCADVSVKKPPSHMRRH